MGGVREEVSMIQEKESAMIVSHDHQSMIKCDEPLSHAERVYSAESVCNGRRRRRPPSHVAWLPLLNPLPLFYPWG